MNLLRQWLWPDVSLRRSAQGAIDEAFWVAVAVSTYRFTFVLIAYLRDSEKVLPLGLLLFALCLALCAVGIHLRSRIAALLAFTLYTLEFFLNLLAGDLGGLIISVLIALALLAGVRGAFAYHKLPAKPQDLPSLAESFRSVKGPTDPR